MDVLESKSKRKNKEYEMAFEKFTHGGARGFQPKISLRNKGQLGINPGAVERYKLENFDYVVLYYDKEARVIAIKPTGDHTEEGVMKLRKNKRTGEATIAAKTLCDYYAIDCYSGTIRMNPKWDDEMQAIIVELPKQEQKGGKDIEEN